MKQPEKLRPPLPLPLPKEGVILEEATFEACAWASVTGPVDVIVWPSGETTIWATMSCPPVVMFTVSRLTTAPGLRPWVFGNVSCTGWVRSRPTAS
jgi:hypothetical protein